MWNKAPWSLEDFPVAKGKTVIDKLKDFEEKDTLKFMRFIKHWPRLVEYEMSVYKRYLAKFCTNETKEWKIGEMWSFEIDSKLGLLSGFPPYFLVR